MFSGKRENGDTRLLISSGVTVIGCATLVSAYSGDSDHPYWFYPITCST